MFDPFMHELEAAEGALAQRDSLLRAEFIRVDQDLVAVRDGRPVRQFPGYFDSARPDDLDVPGNLRLPAALVQDILTGRTPHSEQMAQVIAVEGAGLVRRTPGQRLPLAAGQMLHAGEMIETGAFSMVDLLLATNVKLTVGPMARLRLDRRSLSPAGGSVRVAALELSLLTGAVASLATPIGTSPAIMTLRTPAGWFSWADATVCLQIAVSDEPDSLAVIRQADGPSGSVTLVNDAGTQLLQDGPGIVGINGLGTLRRPPQPLSGLDAYSYAALLPSRRVIY